METIKAQVYEFLWVAWLPCFMAAMKWAGTNDSGSVNSATVLYIALDLDCGIPRIPQKSLSSYFTWIPSGVCAPGVPL